MRYKNTFQGYYLQVDRLVIHLLETATAEYLLSVDFDEYLDYLVEQIAWEPLAWDESNMSVQPIHHRHEPKFLVRIPVTPHSQRRMYLERGPTQQRPSGEPSWEFEGDVVTMVIPASEEAVQKLLENMRFWFGGRNKDIEIGNSRLREQIRPYWERKRQELEAKDASVQQVLQRLNVPLYRDPSAKSKPIEMRPRQLRVKLEPPQPRAKKLEPHLNRQDVEGLVDFIEQYARQFETAPETYLKHDEEELRDLLLGMMNANYCGAGTAETFSKLGKADITLRVEGGHILLCECKFWSGASGYGDALDQLFRYITWRQNYGVLLFLCTRRDMKRAVSEALRAMKEHPTATQGSVHPVSDTRFTSRHIHPQDKDKSVEIHHVFIDLSLPNRRSADDDNPGQ